MSVGVPVTKSFNKLKKYPYEINKFDRRETNEYFYLPVDCPRMKKCDDAYCPLAHTKLEKIFHPIVYKTQACQMAKDGACDYFQKCAFYHDSNDKNEAHLNWTIWEKKWDKWRNNVDNILTQHNKNDKEIRRKVESILKIRMPHFNYNTNKNNIFMNKNTTFHSTWPNISGASSNSVVNSSIGGSMAGSNTIGSGITGSTTIGNGISGSNTVGSSITGSNNLGNGIPGSGNKVSSLNSLLHNSLNSSLSHCSTSPYNPTWGNKWLSGNKKSMKNVSENKYNNSYWMNELSDFGGGHLEKGSYSMNSNFVNKNNMYYDDTMSYNSNATDCGVNFDMLDNNAYKVVEFCFTDYDNNKNKSNWKDGTDNMHTQSVNSFFSRVVDRLEAEANHPPSVRGGIGSIDGIDGIGSICGSDGSTYARGSHVFQGLNYSKTCEYVSEEADGSRCRKADTLPTSFKDRFMSDINNLGGKFHLVNSKHFSNDSNNTSTFDNNYASLSTLFDVNENSRLSNLSSIANCNTFDHLTFDGVCRSNVKDFFPSSENEDGGREAGISRLLSDSGSNIRFIERERIKGADKQTGEEVQTGGEAPIGGEAQIEGETHTGEDEQTGEDAQAEGDTQTGEEASNGGGILLAGNSGKCTNKPQKKNKNKKNISNNVNNSSIGGNGSTSKSANITQHVGNQYDGEGKSETHDKKKSNKKEIRNNKSNNNEKEQDEKNGSRKISYQMERNGDESNNGDIVYMEKEKGKNGKGKNSENQVEKKGGNAEGNNSNWSKGMCRITKRNAVECVGGSNGVTKDKRGSDKGSDKSGDKAGDKSGDMNGDKSDDKNGDKSGDKSGEKSSEVGSGEVFSKKGITTCSPLSKKYIDAGTEGRKGNDWGNGKNRCNSGAINEASISVEKDNNKNKIKNSDGSCNINVREGKWSGGRANVGIGSWSSYSDEKGEKANVSEHTQKSVLYSRGSSSGAEKVTIGNTNIGDNEIDGSNIGANGSNNLPKVNINNTSNAYIHPISASTKQYNNNSLEKEKKKKDYEMAPFISGQDSESKHSNLHNTAKAVTPQFPFNSGNYDDDKKYVDGGEVITVDNNLTVGHLNDEDVVLVNESGDYTIGIEQSGQDTNQQGNLQRGQARDDPFFHTVGSNVKNSMRTYQKLGNKSVEFQRLQNGTSDASVWMDDRVDDIFKVENIPCDAYNNFFSKDELFNTIASHNFIPSSNSLENNCIESEINNGESSDYTNSLFNVFLSCNSINENYDVENEENNKFSKYSNTEEKNMTNICELFNTPSNNFNPFGNYNLYGHTCLQCKHYKTEINNLMLQIKFLREELFKYKRILITSGMWIENGDNKFSHNSYNWTGSKGFSGMCEKRNCTSSVEAND
ncbi:hypothetical protein POVCU2_0032890 [Plasmodium ovale curtisi]|uniref:C3H1-type domain-containing protein n=1 Tax=Plasmodium ovale curtisi TaxID=864141 RepID=A0A1A8WS76_PLAOA|nr:hypothetical protein POVCU2_0032890 [Plasmodium ovale curtisi]SBS95782.1 hypothetical protein POVCU1_030150 [Plasmodium ovale curtisi]